MLATYVLPVLRARLACGGEVRRATVIVAAWSRLDELAAASPGRSRRDPLGHLGPHTAFDDLVGDAGFSGHYLHALTTLREGGVRALLAELVTGRGEARRPRVLDAERDRTRPAQGAGGRPGAVRTG